MKKVFIFLLIAVMVLSVSACSGNSEVEEPKAEPKASSEKVESKETVVEPVTVKLAIWDETQKDSLQRTLDEFNTSQENIVAEIEITPWDNYWTKLDAALGSGEAPDVFWMNVYVNKYVEGKVVEPLDEFISKDGIDLSLYVPGTTGIYTVAGAQYAMPKGMDAVAVALNTEFFEEAGIELPVSDVWTWADMESVAQQMIDAGTLEEGEAPITMELDHQPSYYNFIPQMGGYVVDNEAGTSGFSEPESVKAFEKVIDLMETGRMHDYTTLSETKGTDLFISGKAAILFVGSWKASVLEECSLAQEGKVAIVEMPINGKTNASVQGGLGYAMFSGSENKDAAWEVIKFLTGEVGNTHQAEDKIDVPALISKQEVYKTSFTNIDISAWLDAAATAVPFPFGPHGNVYYGDVGETSAQIFVQSDSAANLLAGLDERIEKLYAEAK